VNTKPMGRHHLHAARLRGTCAGDQEAQCLLFYSILRHQRFLQILVVADEIYGLLTYGGEQASMASVCPEHTIISSGISKWLGAGGWRLGAFIFPSELLWLSDAMGAAASETFSAVSAPVQHASIVAYQGSAEIQDFLRRSNRVLSVVSRFTSRRLHASGVQFADPQGGFYIFPQFSLTEQAAQSRNITDSPSLAAALLEEIGVLGLAASYFGVPAETHSLTPLTHSLTASLTPQQSLTQSLTPQHSLTPHGSCLVSCTQGAQLMSSAFASPPSTTTAVKLLSGSTSWQRIRTLLLTTSGLKVWLPECSKV